MSSHEPDSPRPPLAPLTGAPRPPVSALPTPAASTGGPPGSGGPTLVRRYPVPPPLLRRTALLIINPEQWPAMARYPLRFTLVPLLLVICLAAMAVGAGMASRILPVARDFAAQYDQFYPPLLYQDGKLSVVPTPGKTLPNMKFKDVAVVIDPTGATKLDAIPNDRAILVDAENIYIRTPLQTSPMITPLKDFEKGSHLILPARINGPVLTAFLQEYGSSFALFIGTGVAFCSFCANVLWALVVALMIAPLVQVGARNLRMPRAVAFRIAAAVAVPFIVLGGLLQALDADPTQMMGLDGIGAFWFWLLCALGPAFWAGRMANRMYAPRRTS